MLLFLIEASGVPVLLSLLVLVFTSSTSKDGEEDLDMLPQSTYELYSMATQSAVVQRLLVGRAALVGAGGGQHRREDAVLEGAAEGRSSSSSSVSMARV